ncbi:hypothetical protein L2E82_40476 [Cichorium intybus]|uniref:Uncharacterized protein n=1 Tax=Cichorium intybus TaxID=13427 RepID=A0ACB9AKK5_CICIN|nr:hypothetical protein L2E82_40476 [Cichorium intybus]
MAATTLFSAPISYRQYPISISSFGSKSSWQSSSFPAQSLTKSPLILLRASSSTSTVDKQEDEEERSSSTPSDRLTDQSESIPFGGCKACGKAEIGRGCNGEGRIQGGIATVPGFGWWPIKAYRPCPDFVATGGRYRRQGQSMDEVAGFGSVPRISATTSSSAAASETQSSEKKQGPRKFKR